MMRLAPSQVSDQLQSRQAWCLWPQRPLCSECAPLAVSQARAVPCNSSLSQFPNSFCRLFRCSFVSPLLPCLLSHSALLSLQHNPLSDKACWLRTHSYLQEQPRGAVVEKERVMLIHTFTPGSCPAPCCLTLGSFIWGGGIALLKGTWVNFEEFSGHFLLPLLQSFPRPVLLFLWPSSLSPLHFALPLLFCPSQSHIRSESERGFWICQSAVWSLWCFVCGGFSPLLSHPSPSHCKQPVTPLSSSIRSFFEPNDSCRGTELKNWGTHRSPAQQSLYLSTFQIPEAP